MTETTTQPDPQLVAWMRGYRNPRDEAEKADVVASAARGWLSAHGYASLTDSPYTLDDFRAAYRGAHRGAHIPAGQGVASLYLRDGHLYHRGADGRSRRVEYGGWHEAVDAVDALLAATLPAIDATEEGS